MDPYRKGEEEGVGAVLRGFVSLCHLLAALYISCKEDVCFVKVF